MKTRRATLNSFIAANAAVFAMLAAPAAVDHFYSTDLGMMPVANAADDGGGGGKSAEKSGGHNKPAGAGGVSHRPEPGTAPPAKGKTEPWDPESKPRWMNDGAAGGSSTSRGGKPIWGQDGLVNPATGTSAELGRMNVSRAPAAVFDRQLAEALLALADPATETLKFYTYSVADIKELDLDVVARLDSPLANLAILKVLLTDGSLKVGDTTLTPTTDLLGILLGSASDKYIPITPDTVYAIFKILTKAEPAADLNLVEIATAANDIRVEIMTDHDN